MDKYAVVLDDEMKKLADQNTRTSCPQCGSGMVDYRGITPHCPNCGTEPWENQHGRNKESPR